MVTKQWTAFLVLFGTAMSAVAPPGLFHSSKQYLFTGTAVLDTSQNISNSLAFRITFPDAFENNININYTMITSLQDLNLQMVDKHIDFQILVQAHYPMYYEYCL
jgi:hypothetical protein